MTIKPFINMLLGIAVASFISISAMADDNASQNAGRMSAGGGVQPVDQYSDGACKGDECPDEGLDEDNAATDIPDDNTDTSNGTY